MTDIISWIVIILAGWIIGLMFATRSALDELVKLEARIEKIEKEGLK